MVIGATTEISISARKSSSSLYAVIVVVPMPIPFTFPFDTVAILVSLLVHVNFLFDVKIVDIADNNYSYKIGQDIFIKKDTPPYSIDTDKVQLEQIVDIFAISYLNGRYILGPDQFPKKKTNR